MLLLPFTSDPAQTFTTQLGTTSITFDVRWNERSLTWTADLTDSVSGVILLQGLVLVLGTNLLEPYDELSLPGYLFVYDEDGTGVDAGPTDLGVRVNVYWVDDSEVSS